MKTTIDLPDELLREAKSKAALERISLKELVTAALEERLRSDRRPAQNTGWRAAFGLADKRHVKDVDRILSDELERINPKDWE